MFSISDASAVCRFCLFKSVFATTTSICSVLSSSLVLDDSCLSFSLEFLGIWSFSFLIFSFLTWPFSFFSVFILPSSFSAFKFSITVEDSFLFPSTSLTFLATNSDITALFSSFTSITSSTTISSKSSFSSTASISTSSSIRVSSLTFFSALLLLFSFSSIRFVLFTSIFDLSSLLLSTERLLVFTDLRSFLGACILGLTSFRLSLRSLVATVASLLLSLLRLRIRLSSLLSKLRLRLSLLFDLVRGGGDDESCFHRSFLLESLVKVCLPFWPFPRADFLSASRQCGGVSLSLLRRDEVENLSL